jgi:putative heme-binding domain-containing protein
MIHRSSALGLLVVCALGLQVRAQVPAPARVPFTVPPGFIVEEVYAPTQSGSVLAITFDASGRLVFAREKGPIVRLIDRNGDGRADEEQVVTGEVTNSQGIEFDGRTLLVVGQGPQGAGLYRVPDADGDGRGESAELVTAASFPMSEHGPHDVFFGPDGWLYWIFGNFSGLRPYPSPRSPYAGYADEQLLPLYHDPRGHPSARAPGGTVVRTDLAGGAREWEEFAGGFRNAYDAAFSSDGELLTFDSDMEWDLGLPWYRAVRTVHVVPGGEYGWRSGSGPWPQEYPDNLPPISNVGRGSPTGVAVYQGDRFPAEYRDAFFQADWSRGRILVGFLSRAGATFTERSTEFLLGTPLNVTDLEVGPDGALYFAKGGRGTEGGIYRVSYAGEATTIASAAPRLPARSDAPWLGAALRLPHHRSAWGRAALGAAQRKAGAAWGAHLLAVARDPAAWDADRVRALELLRVYGPRPDVPTLAVLAADAAVPVRAAATYHLGLHASAEAQRALADRLSDDDPLVRRRAAEALVRSGLTPGLEPPFDPVTTLVPLLGDEDRFVRYAARLALERVNRNRWSGHVLAIATLPAATEGLVALARTSDRVADVGAALEHAVALITREPPPGDLAGLLRAMHLLMIRAGYVPFTNLSTAAGEALLARFPSGDALADREIARTLAHLRVTAAIPRLVAALTNPSTTREQQIHFAYCLRAMRGAWSETDRAAIVAWFGRTQAQRWRGGASFDGYLRQIWRDVLDLLPEDERLAARAAVPGLELDATGRPVIVQGAAAYSDAELREYLEFDPMAYAGDPVKGQAVYEKAFCANCHRVGDIGQEAGPDLTDVARRFTRRDLVDAILAPSRTISEQWAAVEIVTRDKRSHAGVITAESADAVTMLTVSGEAVRIPRSGIAQWTRSEVSPMPEGLLNGLSLGEIAHLFAFLERPR